MKKSIAMAALVLSFHTFAEYPIFNITNFTGNYQAPEGSGNADTFTIPETSEIRTNAVSLKVVQKDNGYQFNYGDKEYFYENPPEFLTNVELVTWKNTNLKAKNQKATLSLASFDSTSREVKAKIRDLFFNCIENDSSITDLATKVIDACLANSQGRFQSVLIKQYNEVDGAVKGLSDALQLFSTEEQVAGTSTIDLKNLSLNVNNHRFSLSVKVNLSMKATIKASGSSWYEKDKKRIKVKVSKVKAGFFNITNKVFSELKKSETETFIVEKPYIYFLMK